MEDLTIPARDGYPLAATLLTPAGAARAVVQLNSAVGTARQFYRRFAAFLAEQGFIVVTYDYRGIGGSAPADPREGAWWHIRDWGEQDAVGVTDWCGERFAELPLLLVGHSIGGQLPGLCSNNGRYDRVAAVAAQSGWWKLWPEGLREQRRALWEKFVPAQVAAHGHFPGKAVGMADLPGGIALSWARWCSSPEYIVDDDGAPLREHFHALRAPMRFVAFTDDDTAPLAAVKALMGFYANAPRALDVIAPAHIGVPAIGHFGFFRADCAQLWPRALDWLGMASLYAPTMPTTDGAGPSGQEGARP